MSHAENRLLAASRGACFSLPSDLFTVPRASGWSGSQEPMTPRITSLEECFVRMKSLRLFGLIALAAATLHSQPTNGAVYWSKVAPDCSSLAGESPVAITNSSGTTIGYSCYVSGTFVWLAAGGGWSSSIRVSAPA